MSEIGREYIYNNRQQFDKSSLCLEPVLNILYTKL